MNYRRNHLLNYSILYHHHSPPVWAKTVCYIIPKVLLTDEILELVSC